MILQQNWTPIINDWLDIAIKDITTMSEMKITLVVYRKTIGWNKPVDPISISQFMDATGMCEDSVKTGIELAIQRGTIIKTDHNGPRGTCRYAPTCIDLPSELQVENDRGENLPPVKSTPSTRGKIYPPQNKGNKLNGSKEPLTGTSASSPPPMGDKPNENGKSKSIDLNTYTPLEIWFYENKAGNQPISDSQKKQMSVPNVYVDPQNNQPIENGPSVNKLFHSDQAYIYWLNEEVIPFLKRTNGASLPNTKWYKPNGSDLLKQMRDLKWFYGWRNKNQSRFENNTPPEVKEKDWS